MSQKPTGPGPFTAYSNSMDLANMVQTKVMMATPELRWRGGILEQRWVSHGAFPFIEPEWRPVPTVEDNAP